MTDDTTADTTVYRRRDLSVYLICVFLLNIAVQIQSVAIGWQIYEMEHSTLALGLVGLCQFLPMFLLILPAGEICDRSDPRRLMFAAAALQGVCALLFLLFSHHGTDVIFFYGVLVLFGIARAFLSPTQQALMPFLIAPARLPRAVALHSTAFTVAVIAGPAAGGFLYAYGSKVTYGMCALCFLIPAVLMLTLGGRRLVLNGIVASRMERVKEGIAFVRNRPVVLGAISLDLFAVLLGGATALLPAFARDILHTGPEGLGLLRSAPATGAMLTAVLLTRWPIERHTGFRMFMAVAVFGAATVIFGISHSFMLSVVALFVLGASDMISVFIRRSLIQMATPDGMRGRVGAVNMLFISASNELGEFESGITAFFLGTIPAVVIGGLGTLGIVALWMKLFPALRTVDRLTDAMPKPDAG